MADKKLFVDASRKYGILTFETMDAMLHVNYLKLMEEHSKGTCSAEIELKGIPFAIMRGEPHNAQAFIDQPKKSLWLIPFNEHYFGLKCTILTKNFDFKTGFYNGIVKIHDIPYEYTAFTEEFLQEMAEQQAARDIEIAKKEAGELGDNEPEVKETVTEEVLTGAIEELALQEGWVAKNTPIPIPDKQIYAIIKKHNQAIMRYFESQLEVNGVEAIARVIGHINESFDIVKEIAKDAGKEIKNVRKEIPSRMSFRKVKKLKEFSSGAIIAIKLPDGGIVPFDLEGMPIIGFGSVRAANHAFKALKTHPDWGKYFISQTEVVPIKEIEDKKSLELKAMVVKNPVELLQWMGKNYVKE